MWYNQIGMDALVTRRTALKILTDSEKPGAHTSALLQKAHRIPGINYPLLQKLVKGTLQSRSKIDKVLRDQSIKGFQSFPAELLTLLRLLAYQIVFVEKVPRALVASETLALAKPYRKILSPSNLEALMQRLWSLRGKETSSSLTGTSAAAIAEHFSHPEWLVQRWLDQLGADKTVKLCEANNRVWPVTIRTNTLKISPKQLERRLAAERVRVSPGKALRDCFVIEALPRGKRLTDLEAFRSGLIQVQDESSALVGLAVAPEPGEFVADLCAAPGGKAAHMAMLMKNRGSILAVDVHAHKLKSIAENCRRLGLRIIKTKTADATRVKLEREADRVLVDAPCSGSGVVGRKADIRWSKDEKVLTELRPLQLQILVNAAKLVRRGGVLVYSTCSVLQEENEGVVRDFLRQHPEYSVLHPTNIDSRFVSTEGFVRSWPHRHGIGGAFAAVLKRS